MKINKLIISTFLIFGSTAIGQSWLSLPNGKMVILKENFRQKPTLIQFLENNSQDLTFGDNGEVTIPIKSNVKVLKLIYNPSTGTIFILDPNTADIIVVGKTGKIINTLAGKENSNLVQSGQITIRFTNVGSLHAFQEETERDPNFPGVWSHNAGEGNGDIVAITYNIKRDFLDIFNNDFAGYFASNSYINEIIDRLDLRNSYISLSMN